MDSILPEFSRAYSLEALRGDWEEEYEGAAPEEFDRFVCNLIKSVLSNATYVDDFQNCIGILRSQLLVNDGAQPMQSVGSSAEDINQLNHFLNCTLIILQKFGIKTTEYDCSQDEAAFALDAPRELIVLEKRHYAPLAELLKHEPGRPATRDSIFEELGALKNTFTPDNPAANFDTLKTLAKTLISLMRQEGYAFTGEESILLDNRMHPENPNSSPEDQQRFEEMLAAHEEKPTGSHVARQGARKASLPYRHH